MRSRLFNITEIKLRHPGEPLGEMPVCYRERPSFVDEGVHPILGRSESFLSRSDRPSWRPSISDEGSGALAMDVPP